MIMSVIHVGANLFHRYTAVPHGLKSLRSLMKTRALLPFRSIMLSSCVMCNHIIPFNLIVEVFVK